MRKLCLLLLPGMLLFSSCWNLNKSPELPPPKKVWGYKPVVSVDSSALVIQSVGPQDVKLPGKIYVKGNLVFQNDLGSGIHVFDNSNPSSMHTVGFIRILGSLELSIRGTMLYTNSYEDLVVVDISDWQNAKEMNRIKRAFRQGGEARYYTMEDFVPLPERGVYYECPWRVTDGITRILTGWVRDSVYDNNCYYP